MEVFLFFFENVQISERHYSIILVSARSRAVYFRRINMNLEGRKMNDTTFTRSIGISSHFLHSGCAAIGELTKRVFPFYRTDDGT